MKPLPLNTGDTIAIAATARKISLHELQPAINIFQNWGLNVVLAENIVAAHHQFAGNDHQRIAAFQQLINDTNLKAIICARGGYGTIRIIDEIDFSPLLSQPKWIIGYSDITVLHSKLHNMGLPSLHATMPINMQPDKIDLLSVETLHKTLFTGVCPPIQSQSSGLNVHGNATGVLVGGNLSVLYSQLGSGTDINTDAKILFLEDLDEYLYHIDRMMMALKRSGKLSNLAGLVVGSMSDMKDNTIPFGSSAEEIIHQHCHTYGYPIAMHFPAGHEPQNLPLLFGSKYQLSVYADGSELVML